MFRRKKEEGRRKKEEGRRKKEEVGGKSEGSRIELFRREDRCKKGISKKREVHNFCKGCYISPGRTGDRKPGFFLDTSLPNQDLSHKPGL